MPENPGDGKTKTFLIELIAKRKKFLTHLRRWDYKRFEWLLVKLNLVYKPYPKVWRRVDRKGSMRALTKDHCRTIKWKKLQEYRNVLKAEKKTFFIEKVSKLEFIRNEEISCGREPTVTEEEIEAARQHAAAITSQAEAKE